MRPLSMYVLVGAASALAGWTIAGCATTGKWSERSASTNVIKLTAANFERTVLASPKPVLVDFWAPWCPPCRALGPVVSELSDDYQGRVVVGMVNVDDETALSEKYNIEGIPAVFIFTNGTVAHKLEALHDKKDYTELLDKLVPPAPAPAPAPAP